MRHFVSLRRWLLSRVFFLPLRLILLLPFCSIFIPTVEGQTYYWSGDILVEKLQYRRHSWRDQWATAKKSLKGDPNVIPLVKRVGNENLQELIGYLNTLGIKVFIKNQWVYLSGSVSNAQHRAIANTIAHTIVGNERIIDSIKIVR